MDPSNFPFFFPWLFVLRGLFYILFFVYFVKIYRAEKTGSNEYYLGFLSIFAGIVFVLPLLQYIITLLIGLSVSGEESSNMAIQMQSLTRTFHMMLFGISIIMSSHVLKKNGLKFLAAAVLFLYILVSVIYNEITFRVGLNAQTTISLLMIYDNVVISIGYILNALVLKRS
ncbi:MAG TPA: hypothetical protein DHN33_05690 [Eubacteriaceae bacterium]|nr:hypothetical protein [Eubacteriaceae bacterium]